MKSLIVMPSLITPNPSKTCDLEQIVHRRNIDKNKILFILICFYVFSIRAKVDVLIL